MTNSSQAVNIPAISISVEQGFSNGIWLAWIILVGMLLALIITGIVLARSFHGKSIAESTGILSWATPVLSLLGVVAAVYLTYVEGRNAQAICGPIGDCNAVQDSPYAMIFGVIPVGLFGALGYVAILTAWAWRRWHKGKSADMAGPTLLGMSIFGVLYSIYLTYLEIFVIHAVCI